MVRDRVNLAADLLQQLHTAATAYADDAISGLTTPKQPPDQTAVDALAERLLAVVPVLPASNPVAQADLSVRVRQAVEAVTIACGKFAEHIRVKAPQTPYSRWQPQDDEQRAAWEYGLRSETRLAMRVSKFADALAGLHSMAEEVAALPVDAPAGNPPATPPPPTEAQTWASAVLPAVEALARVCSHWDRWFNHAKGLCFGTPAGDLKLPLTDGSLLDLSVAEHVAIAAVELHTAGETAVTALRTLGVQLPNVEDLPPLLSGPSCADTDGQYLALVESRLPGLECLRSALLALREQLLHYPTAACLSCQPDPAPAPSSSLPPAPDIYADLRALATAKAIKGNQLILLQLLWDGNGKAPLKDIGLRLGWEEDLDGNYNSLQFALNQKLKKASPPWEVRRQASQAVLGHLADSAEK